MKRILVSAFIIVAAANLASVTAGATVAEWLTKPLLMPILIGLLWTLGSRSPVMTTGLVFATAADVFLLVDGGPFFLMGMGCFAVMQLCFIHQFAQQDGRWCVWIPLAYGVMWVALIITLWSDFGELAVPIAVYSLLLVTMAAAASRLGARHGLGGALFVASDLLIGIGVAGYEFPGRSLMIMATYIAAQYLLVTGWARVSRAS